MKDVISDSFLRNLKHFYPGRDPDPQARLKWIEEAKEFANGTHEDVEGAWEDAVEKHKASSSDSDEIGDSEASKGAFSSLDFLLSGGGGGLSLPPSLELITDAPPDEKLELLGGIEYMDDVIHDWDAYEEMLRAGLQLDVSGYTSLARKWFGLSRAGQEHLIIQQGITGLLLETTQSSMDQLGQSDLTEIVGLVHAIWIDWMVRNVSVEKSVQLKLLASLASWSFDRHLQDILVRTDPTATWFRLWALKQRPEVVSTESRESLSPLSDSIRKLTENTSGSSMSARDRYHISLLSGLLCSLRVPLFQWESFGLSSPDRLRQLFVDAASKSEDADFILICSECRAVCDHKLNSSTR